MENALVIIIAVVCPWLIRGLMRRFNVDGLSYIMLYLFASTLVTMGYPVLGLFSVIQVTLMLVASMAGLD